MSQQDYWRLRTWRERLRPDLPADAVAKLTPGQKAHRTRYLKKRAAAEARRLAEYEAYRLRRDAAPGRSPSDALS